jgi:hypothetical protein
MYWNTTSEIFIPTSLWEQTRGMKYQIFEAVDASFLRDIMTEYDRNLPYNFYIIVLSVIAAGCKIPIFSRHLQSSRV